MKKLFAMAVLAAGMGTAAQAQTEPAKGEDLKAAAGEVSLEANVGITNGNVNLSNALNQIKGRYFLSDDMALRLGFNLSRESEFSIDNDGDRFDRTAFMFSINPGIEKHFAGTNRLSPYVGAELSLGINSLNEEGEESDGSRDYEVDGGWSNGNRGYFSVGVNAVAGMDFYVARHLFVGYELGFGLHFRKDSDIESTQYFNNNTSITVTNEGDGNFEVGPRVLNGVRVGFVF